MKYSQLAAQLFTVRDYLLDASAFADTIKRLKAIEYPAVELIPSETVSDKEIAKICEEAGVKIASAHVPGQLLLERPEEIVAKMQVLGVASKYVDKEVIFGIRPEQISNEPNGPSVPINLKVEIAEPMGSESLVYLKTGSSCKEP